MSRKTDSLPLAFDGVFTYFDYPSWVEINDLLPVSSNFTKTEIEFLARHYQNMVRDCMDSDDDNLRDICAELKYLSEDIIISSIIDLEPNEKICLTYEDMCNARVNKMFRLFDYFKGRFFDHNNMVKSEICKAFNVLGNKFSSKKDQDNKKKLLDFMEDRPEVYAIIKSAIDDVRYFQPNRLIKAVREETLFFDKARNVIETLQHLEVYYRNSYPDVDYFHRLILSLIDYHINSKTENLLIELYDFKKSEIEKYKEKYLAHKQKIEKLLAAGKDKEADTLQKRDIVFLFDPKNSFTQFSIPKLIASEVMEKSSPLYQSKLRVKVKAFLFRHYMLSYMDKNGLDCFTRDNYEETLAHISEAKKIHRNSGKVKAKPSLSTIGGKDIEIDFIPTNETASQYLNFGSFARQATSLIRTELAEGMERLDDKVILGHALAIVARSRELGRTNPKEPEMQKAVQRLINSVGESGFREMLDSCRVLEPAIEMTAITHKRVERIAKVEKQEQEPKEYKYDDDDDASADAF